MSFFRGESAAFRVVGVADSWFFLFSFPKIMSPCAPFSTIDLAGAESCFCAILLSQLSNKTNKKMEMSFFMDPLLQDDASERMVVPGKRIN